MPDAAATPAPASVRFECVIPILRVADVRASIRIYQDVLGFKRDWGGEGDYPDHASVSRGRASVMLCEGGQGNPGTWVWFGVDDVGPLYEQYAARGATIELPPTNFPWAREFRVRDPDGHVLRFGSEPVADSREQRASHWNWCTG
jgi:catechol 2,3-dioxygenase-like lactoylglutathione lyase family enzyme